MASFNTPAYRLGYMAALKQTQQNETKNLEANTLFQETGKLMGTLDDIPTIKHGDTEQMRALIKQYMGSYIIAQDIDGCIAPLHKSVVEWLYENLSSVRSMLQKTFGGEAVNCVQWKSLIDTMYSQADVESGPELNLQEDPVSGMMAAVPTVGSQSGKMKGKGCCGGGVKVKKVEPIMPGAQKGYRFREFGKYVVDLEKLRDNELVVKYKNGKRVARIDSKVMGGNLAEVVKKVSEGTSVGKSELSKLSEDERTYLDVVRKEARVLGLDDLSTSIRSQKNRERHEFEVAKGQILAGNDNPALVKKFKLLLVKLRKSGQLPEREARELLMDMAALGV